MPALGAGILFKGDRVEYQLQFLMHHLSICLPLLIQPRLRNIAVLDWNL